MPPHKVLWFFKSLLYHVVEIQKSKGQEKHGLLGTFLHSRQDISLCKLFHAALTYLSASLPLPGEAELLYLLQAIFSPSSLAKNKLPSWQVLTSLLNAHHTHAKESGAG